MFGGGDATTEVARMWFMAYIFIVTMLCSDLFVGVIVSLYSDVQSIKSSRLGAVFVNLLELPSQSRAGVTTSVLKLNREMGSISQLITDIEVGDNQKWAYMKHMDRGRKCAADPNRIAHCTSALTNLKHAMKDVFAPATQTVARMAGVFEQDQLTLWLEQQTSTPPRTCVETTSVQVLWNLMMGCKVGVSSQSPVASDQSVLTDAASSATPLRLEDCANSLSDWMVSFVAAVCNDCMSQFIDVVGFDSSSHGADARTQLNRLARNNDELPANCERWNKLREASYDLCIGVLEANNEETWCPPVQHDQLAECMTQLWVHLELDTMVAHTVSFYQQINEVCARARTAWLNPPTSPGYNGPVVVNRKIRVRQSDYYGYDQMYLKRSYAANRSDVSEKDEDTPFYWGMRIYNSMQTMNSDKDLAIDSDAAIGSDVVIDSEPATNSDATNDREATIDSDAAISANALAKVFEVYEHLPIA